MGSPDRASWEALGDSLKRTSTGTQWVIGDWLCYGDATFGSVYDTAEKLTGLDKQTLRNLKWVASKFAPSLRKDTLAYSHYLFAAMLPLSEALALLDRAEAEDWRVSRTLAEVQAARQKPVPALDPRAERLSAALKAAESLQKLVGDLYPDLASEIGHVVAELQRRAETRAPVFADEAATPEDMAAGRYGRRL